MKKFLIILITVLVLGGAMFYFLKYMADKIDSGTSDMTERAVVKTTEPEPEPVPEPVVVTPEVKTTTVIGSSVDGRDIVAYHFGTGEEELLFVAGMHGGYEWNTTLLAYDLIDYFNNNPTMIPENVSITIIPTLNPDGLYEVVGTSERFTVNDVPSDANATIPGRFNANKVDLNRNFDCDWQPTGTWQSNPVSGGSAVFSEPESKAIRDYINGNKPTAAIVWYSSVGGVFSSNCHNGVLPETKTLTNLYANASGYKAYENFDFYEITGDMVNWFAKENIPAISVLLTTHEDTETNKNIAGVKAILDYYN